MALRTKTLLAAIAALGLISVSIVRAVPPPPSPSASFGIYALTSTASIAPTHNPGDQFFKYTYTITSGASLNDSIPILVCLDASTGSANGDWSDEVTADSISGGFAAAVTVATPPWSFNQASAVATTHTIGDPGCQVATVNINVPAGALATPGGYNTNVHFKLQNGTPSTGPSQLSESFSQEKMIKLFVNVIPGASTSRAYCFLTDSEGDFLQKCDGSPASLSGETDGTFSIVANKKNIEVATNPGQFYYNLLWNNDTGSDQVVTVTIAANGLTPNGKQALHWATFLTSTFSGVSPTTFEEAIEGTPAGTTGPISSIPVPAGHTLYVTYHLEYTRVGLAVPSNCSSSCGSANQPVSVGASVIGNFGTDLCSAGAAGYLKQ
jgi:hypothetical protein